MGEKHGSGIRCRGCESAVMVSSRVIVLKNNRNNKTLYTTYDLNHIQIEFKDESQHLRVLALNPMGRLKKPSLPLSFNSSISIKETIWTDQVQQNIQAIIWLFMCTWVGSSCPNYNLGCCCRKKNIPRTLSFVGALPLDLLKRSIPVGCIPYPT